MTTANTAKVGLLTAIAIVVANMVGTGVFGSLGFQVIGIPSAFPIMVLWFTGGIVAFCGAVCYAELASMFPRNGGEYHLLSKSWGPFVGFLAGWISVTIGFAAPVALNASLLGEYLGDGNIFAAHRLWFSVPVVLAVTLIHLGKLTFIGGFQSVFTYSKVVLIIVLGFLGFFIGTAQPLSFLPQEGDGGLITSSSFAISLVYVLYAYTGWNAATYMIDEVKDPKRTVPLALLLGTAIVAVLYLFLNASFLYSTPIEDMKGEPEVGLVAAKSILGERGGMIMGLLISFGLISTISSMTWAGPRVTSSIGHDYKPFRLLEKTNRFGIPVIAVLLQTVIVLVLLCTTSFPKLLQYTQALLTLSSLLVVLGMWYVRIRHPEIDRPYRAWGYPVTPFVFAAVSVYVLIYQIKEETVAFFWGLATLALGAVVYFFVRKHAANYADS